MNIQSAIKKGLVVLIILIAANVADAGDFQEKMLRTIAMVESHDGKYLEHAPLNAGMHKNPAIGRYGLTLPMIKDAIKLDKDLAKYSWILSAEYETVKNTMIANPKIGKDIASSHLKRLRKHFGDSPKLLGHAWLSGIVGTKRAIKEGKSIKEHWHVRKIISVFNEI